MLLELAVAAALAGEVDTVVLFDNGEFDLPLFTPRSNGKWSQPSVAEEIVTGIARVSGENPKVWSYLPPGRTPGRPGAPFPVRPHLAKCVGPSASPADRCWCNPGDKCWEDLAANFHPDASTSLYLTTSAVREDLAGQGPRIEVHFADLFEEDPTAADSPGDSDRCVTLDGTRKAVEGLLRLRAGESLDHLAVGVLEVEIAPPPRAMGFTYDLVPDEESGPGCWSGSKGAAWDGRRQPHHLSMAVFVLGVDTAEHRRAVDGFLDGLAGQLDAEAMHLELVRLREPAPVGAPVERVLSVDEVAAVQLEPPELQPRLPCDAVSVEARLTAGGLPLTPTAIGGTCSGDVVIGLSPDELRRAFLREAGVDPRADRVEVTGRVVVESDPSSLVSRFMSLGERAARGDRPLPHWAAVGEALGLPPDGRSDPAWGAWRREIPVAALAVVGVDTRPWALSVVGSFAAGVGAAFAVFLGLQKIHADRAFRTHWDRNVGPGRDPLRQRPLAAVLAEAEEEVQKRWGQRVGAAVMGGMVTAALVLWMLLRLHLVRLG